MRADRDKKVAIKRPNTDAGGQNEYGERNPADWLVVAENIWASISQLNGREYWQAEQVQSKINTRIELDYISGIDRSMRVYYGSRIFEIIAVIDPKEMHRTLQLMCEELEP
jgi:SPP1 family predicted phage head-tail adaptor